jgi:lysophospholipase L1-like esterase
VKWRNAKFIRETLAAHPPSWVIDTPPPESIAALDDEIRALIESIRRTGAIPILATHAMRATDPPRAEDMGALEEMRVFVPRFPPATIIAFNTAANDSLRSLARQLDVPVADVARTLDGRAECFLDLVHFTGAGNALVASVMAPQIAAALDQLPRAAHAVQ